MAVTCVVIGLLAGMFNVLFGVGGGLIMVPGMTLLLAMRTHRAVGTSLAVVLPLAIFSVTKYLAVEKINQQWDWLPVIELAVGGVFGAMLGATLANTLRARHLRRLFGAVVIAVGIYLVLTPQFAQGREILHPPWSLMLLAGIGVGAISGLLGIGGGLVMVPVLVTLLGYSQKLAQGISLAVIVPVSISGALIHFRNGNVSLRIAAWLVAGGLLGIQIIGPLIGQIENSALRILFGLFLVVVGISMVLQRSRASRPPGAGEPPIPAGESAPTS
ncbi:MAG: sulfite exporter TauE/SafE family protein [Armatimonadetes bacterium]|nr:sulfite exporter TauE/SafE family protein [Armatimonadota bacterium]